MRLNEGLRALEKGLASPGRYFRRYGLVVHSGELLGRVRAQIDRFGVG